MKTNFNSPFFTDPDYMEKEEKKFNSLFKIIIFLKIIVLIIAIIIIAYGIGKIQQSVQDKGGIGNTIGHFLEDIKNPK